MLKVKLINEQATLNNFFYLEAKEYTPGKSFKIIFQIFDAENGIRLIPNSAGTMNVFFQKRDGTELTKAASKPFVDDRSIWQVILSDSEATDIVGSNFRIELNFDGASDIRVGMSYNSLSKITFDGDC